MGAARLHGEDGSQEGAAPLRAGVFGHDGSGQRVVSPYAEPLQLVTTGDWRQSLL